MDSLVAFIRWDPMMIFMPPALLAPTMDLRRRASIEHRVRPRSVVTVDPAADPCPGLGAGLEGLEIHTFVLEAAPQPLDHDVAPASP